MATSVSLLYVYLQPSVANVGLGVGPTSAVLPLLLVPSRGADVSWGGKPLQCPTARLAAAPAFSCRAPRAARDGERNGNPKMSRGVSGKNQVGLLLAEAHNSEAFSQLCLSFIILLKYQKEVSPTNRGLGAT